MYTVISVASKTINITAEAYEILRARKRENESFTDVILRLAGERRLSELAGVLSEAEGRRLEAAVREGRRRSNVRRDRFQGAL